MFNLTNRVFNIYENSSTETIDRLDIIRQKLFDGYPQSNYQKNKETLERITNGIFYYSVIKQSELFEKVKEKSLKPGVFYNFVCRASSLENTKKYNRNAHKSLFSPSMRNLFATSSTNPRYTNNLKSKYKQHLLKHIEEAELHRKPFLHLANNSRNKKNNKKSANNTRKNNK